MPRTELPGSKTPGSKTVVIVLPSLVSEGTPHMALDMCERWLATGVRPVLLVLDARDDEMRPQFAALGVEIVDARLGDTGYARFMRLTATVRALLRRTRAVGVVSMLFGWHAFIAIGAKMGGARIVAHIGNHPGGLTPSGLAKLRLLERIGRPFTDGLVCCSDYVRRGAIDSFALPPGSTHLVYNGVALDAFAPLPGIARGDVPVVVMVARLEGHKDQATLIRAVAVLRDRGRPVMLRLVGDGRLRGELEALAASLGITERVEFCGFRSDVGRVLAEASVFAFSTTADEGLGIALIEAMVAEVPIVASDVGACRETLDGGTCGLLVAPGDADALAEGIAHVLDDPAAAEARVTAARARAFEQFDARAMADRYLALVS